MSHTTHTHSPTKAATAIGRQIPSGVGSKLFRKVCNRGSFLGMFGAVLLVGAQDTRAQDVQAPALDDVATAPAANTQTQDVHPLHSPIASVRIDAEIAAVEAAFYGEVDIVNIDHDKYTDAGDTMFDPDGPEGEAEPVRIFYSPRLAELEADFLEAFNAAGTFDMDPDSQAANMQSYIPEGALEDTTQTVNQILARSMARSSMGTLVTAPPAGAYAVPLEFETGRGDENIRVCLTRFVPSSADEDSFMGSFLGQKTLGVDHELADIQQYVANHEIGHCLTAERGMPTWVKETLADAYAMTRHYQLNGEDGMADTILSMRRYKAFVERGGDHNTVPGLERLLPRLREASAQGRLDGLNPREVLDMSFELMMGSTEQEVMQSFEEIQAEYGRQRADYTVLRIVAEPRDGQLALREDVPIMNEERLQETVDAVNAAVGHLSRPNPGLDAATVNSSEAEVDFRDNMDEYIATQATPQIALEGIQARLFTMDRIEEAYIEQEGADSLHELHEAHGADKITFERKREIYQGYEQQLEQQIEQGRTQGEPAVAMS